MWQHAGAATAAHLTPWRQAPVTTPTTMRAGGALVGLGLLAATLVAPGPATAAAEDVAPAYTLTDLGTLPGGNSSLALGVNADGTAVGTSKTSTSFRPQVAALWRDGQVQNLGTLPGSTFSRAFAVNDSGRSVGEAFTPSPEVSRAVQWEADGTITDLGTLGGRSAVANDLDERGQAYGSSSQASGPSLATVWMPGGPVALPSVDAGATGSSRASAATADGDAVGSGPSRVEDGSTVTGAVRWTQGAGGYTATLLDRLEPGRFATALGVSDDGLAVGEATRLDPVEGNATRTSTRAVQWNGAAVRELPAVGAFRFTRAISAADNGDAVGFASGFAGFPSIDGAAVLWRGDTAYDLNTRVSGGTDGLVLRNAASVNERGQIVGFGTRGSENRAFLLTPVGPAPSLAVVGLTSSNTLVGFRTDNTRPSRRAVPITGLAGDTRLVGIDHRVSDGLLYGVGNAGGVYKLAASGAATEVGRLSVALDGRDFGVDVDPAVDALRILSDTGQNLSQSLADPSAPTTVGPALGRGLTGAASTGNDLSSDTTSTLFVADTVADELLRLTPAGVLETVGPFGLDATPVGDLDITSTQDASGRTTSNVGYGVGRLPRVATAALLRIDLLTGAVTRVGTVGSVVDLALVPQ